MMLWFDYKWLIELVSSNIYTIKIIILELLNLSLLKQEIL